MVSHHVWTMSVGLSEKLNSVKEGKVVLSLRPVMLLLLRGQKLQVQLSGTWDQAPCVCSVDCADLKCSLAQGSASCFL